MKKIRFLVAGAVFLALMVGPATVSRADDDAQEEEITISKAPRIVRRTLRRESWRGKIEEITRKSRDDKTWYEADVRIDGKKYELVIDVDGMLIEKVLEVEEEGEDKNEGKRAGTAGQATEWMDSFDEDKADLRSSGKNPYFSLQPGYVLRLRNDDGDELTITVLEETKMVDGVETRVVEERETEDGELTEVSLNWFAISRKTGNVYYFGEESRDYKDGKMVGQSGSWEAGKRDARFGMIMPAKPKVGQKYYQEIAPKQAMDRAENVSLSETVKVPAGEFKNCLKTQESSAIERGKEYKFYAPGVGLLIDEDFKLVSYGFEKAKRE